MGVWFESGLSWFEFLIFGLCLIFFLFTVRSSSDMMNSFFIPIFRHFFNRHFWQNRLVMASILQLLSNGHINSLPFRALRLKNALHDSHVIALKLQPRALSPQTPQTLENGKVCES